MANTYTQILVQIVFAVKGRQNLILEEYRPSIEKYMQGIITNKKSRPLAIYCNPDHCHILIGLHPMVSISEMARNIKSSSSRWINEKGWISGKFSWQNGYGAFSYSKSHLHRVVRYILNQPIHHKKYTFKDEYYNFLKKFEIEHDEKYFFDWN